MLAVVERGRPQQRRKSTPKPPDPVAKRLGHGLKTARLNAKLSSAEVSQRLTVWALAQDPPRKPMPPTYMSRWEKGTRRLDLETIELIEDLMGITRGTVLRLAGYVSDNGTLTALDTLDPGTQNSIRVLIDAAQRKAATAIEGVDGQDVDGVERPDE